MKRSALLSASVLSLLFLTTIAAAQVTFYGPIDFGAGAPTGSAGVDIGTVATGWTSDPVLTGGTLTNGGWGGNSSSASTGYTGASGNNNAMVESRVAGPYPAGAHLISPSINTSSYSGVEVRFGRRFSGSTSNPMDPVTVSYSTDGGTTFVTTGLTNNVLTWASGWGQVTVSGFPSVSSLKIRWTAGHNGTIGTQNFRIDDVEVLGVSTTLNDGDGTATLVNNAGPLAGSAVFTRNATQSVLITVTGVSTGLLNQVVVTVPSGWTGLTLGNVTLGGAFTGNTPSVVGSDITINAAALGTTPGTIAVTGLTSPNPVGAQLNGNSTWIVKTAKTGGTADTILAPPKSWTIIPVQNIRTGGVDGFGNSDAGGLTPAMAGQIVAVSGVATVENQIISASASQTSFFLQNAGYGVQVFRPSSPATAFARGDSIIVRGTVGAFNGSMQISPPSTASPDFFNVGPGTLPAPLVLPNAAAVSEQHEGKLVRVNSVTWDSAGLTFTATVGPRNSFRTAPADTGTLFLTSTNTIVGTTIPDSSAVVGIVYHRNDILTGVPAWKVAARDLFDIVAPVADGSGTATLVNGTAGTFTGSTVFPRATAGQTVTVTVTGPPTGLMDKVKLTVPSGWGSYSTANVSVGGAFTGKVPVFSGNDIQINAAALGTTPGTITVTGLTSPNPVGAGVSGRDGWDVQTAVSGGVLTSIATVPASHTIIPIQNLRTGGTDGFGNSNAGGTTPVLTGTIVAVQGVVTVPNRVLAETTSTSIIIQDGTFGVQVFRSGAQSHTTLLLGTTVVAKGTVDAFNGNTEILPASVTAPNVFTLGAGVLPAPQVLATAAAVAESTEARLVRLASVAWDSAGQNFIFSGSTAADNNFTTGADRGTIYLNSVNPITGTVIPASSPLTGVVYHRADWTGGNQTIYKVAPRNLGDLGTSGVATTVSAGWNMISNPVLTASDSVLDLFPTSLLPYAFSFSGAGGYQQNARLANGVGYWGKFPGTASVIFDGGVITSDTFAVSPGWNMVGSISSAVDTGSIVSNPADLRSSTAWFGYSGAYAEAATLQPGRGYWVKARSAGTFILTGGPAPARAAAVQADPAASLNSITLRDALGREQTLRFGESTRELEGELPPAPPEGAFDVRFETATGGAAIKTHAAGAELAVAVRSAAAPLTISWNIRNGAYRLEGAAAKTISGSGALTVAGPVTRLTLRPTAGAEVPADFLLRQNYPNPFNPATTIRFGLPVQAQVTVRVYSMLGQEVARPFSGVLGAGYHDVVWAGTSANGTPLASGVYFYRLEAQAADGSRSFTDVQRMMLVK